MSHIIFKTDKAFSLSLGFTRLPTQQKARHITLRLPEQLVTAEPPQLDLTSQRGPDTTETKQVRKSKNSLPKVCGNFKQLLSRKFLVLTERQS